MNLAIVFGSVYIQKLKEALEGLFGIDEKPKRGPEDFMNFENNILQVPRQTCR
jgi:hypothetical protein